MSDTDLTQYNGSASFPATADAGTNADPYLVPTDGKIVSATSNLLDEAPVNRALQRVKDLLLGLRDAVIGDRAGAVRRTLRSVDVDGGGGAVSALGAGNIRASGFVIAIQGVSSFQDVEALRDAFAIRDVISIAGNIRAIDPANGFVLVGTGETATLRPNRLFWAGVTAASNPPATTALRNELRAKNITKAACQIVTNGAGGITLVDEASFNVASVSFVGLQIRVTFAQPFATANWTCVRNANAAGLPKLVGSGSRLAGQGDFYIDGIDPTTTACVVDMVFYGQQA